jgi:oligopeptide transport system permease protein
MLRFILARLLSSVVVIWTVITLSFLLMRFAPGSPFDADRRLPAQVEANKWIDFGLGEEIVASIDGVVSLGPVVEGAQYAEGVLICTLTGSDGVVVQVPMTTAGKLVTLGVRDGDVVEADQRLAVVPKPMLDQYLSSLIRYATLDFGVTISSEGQRTVWENLTAALPISMELGLWALVLALLLGVGSGLLAGLKQNTWIDHTVMSAAMVGLSVPTIVSGPLFIVIFVYELEWFRYGSWETWQDKVLPIVTLGLVYTASFARLTRGGMLEVIRSDYIRTARAKGLSERTVVMRHALKGAMLPTVSYLGPAIARIVTGSIIVERVFGLPGLGEFFITPALNRDYPMVLGVVVLYAMLLVLMNLLVDIAYTFLDPRVSYER